MNDLAALVTDVPQDARFDVAQFIAIGESGALDRFAKSELINGRIVVVNAQAIWHMRTKIAVLFALSASLRESGSNLEMGSEGSVMFEPASMPEPDVFIWDPAEAGKWVAGESVKLVVEVASTTADQDLVEKRLLYAAHGVPEYWVIVEERQRIERFADPREGDFRRHDSLVFDEACSSLTLPGVTMPAGTIRG